MNVKPYYDFLSPNSAPGQDENLVNILREVLDDVPAQFVTDQLREFVHGLAFFLLDDSGHNFERRSGQLYIRPTVFEDLTRKRAFYIADSLATHHVDIFDPKVDMTLRDNRISGCGVLMLIKGGGLDTQAINNILRAYTERDEQLKRYTDNYTNILENTGEGNAFTEFVKTLKKRLSLIREKVYREEVKKIDDEVKFYGIMSVAFAPCLNITDETHSLLRFSKKSFYPSLSLEYFQKYIQPKIDAEALGRYFYGADSGVITKLMEVYGGGVYDALVKDKQITPLTLAVLRFCNKITPARYAIAIANIKQAYELRPSGELDGDSLLY